jgi:hypothetical protein
MTLHKNVRDRKRKRQGKEKEVTNDCKSTFITEDYKKVHNDDGYSVLREKPYESLYFKDYVLRHMCEKSPTNMV